MIKNQTNLIENGIYYISSVHNNFPISSGIVTLTRTSDFDSIFEENNGSYR